MGNMSANIVHGSEVKATHTTPSSYPPEVNIVDVDPSVAVLEQRAQGAISFDPTKVLSRTEYKKLMRQYFTIHHPNVEACGHKLDPERQPNNNCEACWFAFFNVHGDLIETTDECLKKLGEGALTALRGEKYVKNFKKFMSTLAQWQATAEAAKGVPAVKEIDGEISTGSISASDERIETSDAGSTTGSSAGDVGGALEGSEVS